MNKRGLSTIIITLILIALALVAIGIFWIVVRNMIQSGVEEINLGKFTLSAGISNVNVDNSTNNVSLTVKRNPGAGELSGIEFIFSDGLNSEVVKREVSMKELQERRFSFILNMNVNNLISISIVPIIKKDNKEFFGNIMDKYLVKEGISLGPGGGACTPSSCSALGYTCGVYANGTCSGTLNCGNCSTGYSCISGTCQLGTCTPTNCTSLGYQCGTWANGTCSGSLFCGNCLSGYNCNASGRCVANCVPKTSCNSGECGTWSNGTCSGILNCGGCGTGYSCVGGSCVVQTGYVYAASCSRTNVQSAINSASSGDTVVVPAGNCIWSSELGITKGIILQGAGIGNTTIISGINDLQDTRPIKYIPTVSEATKIFEISGFTFDGNYTSGCFAATAPNAVNVITGMKIHNNKFVNCNTRAILLTGLEFGVFYNNQFQDNYVSITGSGSEMNGWNYPLIQGGANYPFFEDNNFVQTIARGGFITENGRGGRLVFRHNNIIGYGGSGGELWDSHGVNGIYPTDTGIVSAEYYDNNIGLSANTRIFFHRGGKAIVFNNKITGSSGNMQMTEYQGWWYCTAQGYPKYQQINSSFYWNNTNNDGSSLIPTVYCSSGSCTSCVPAQYDVNYIQLNRDYWLPTSGLDASKPGSCTDGNYYAATDTERLYVCQSNTWILYYQSYTYPHPLTLIP